jgi:mannose-6-phosphate isomerase-like protein (cupin superfamily)
VSVEGGQLEGGISPPQEGAEWHILGHTYWNRAWSEATFAFETYDPPGTFVPPHIHPHQDEFIFVFEGRLEVELDGQRHPAAQGWW